MIFSFYILKPFKLKSLWKVYQKLLRIVICVRPLSEHFEALLSEFNICLRSFNAFERGITFCTTFYVAIYKYHYIYLKAINLYFFQGF